MSFSLFFLTPTPPPSMYFLLRSLKCMVSLLYRFVCACICAYEHIYICVYIHICLTTYIKPIFSVLLWILFHCWPFWEPLRRDYPGKNSVSISQHSFAPPTSLFMVGCIIFTHFYFSKPIVVERVWVQLRQPYC